MSKKKKIDLEQDAIDLSVEAYSATRRTIVAIWRFLAGHNLVPIVVVAALLWFLLPRILNRSAPYNDDIVRKRPDNLIPARKVVPDQKYDLIVPVTEIINGEEKKVDKHYYITKSGNVYAHKYDRAKLIGTFSRFDFRLQPGIAILTVTNKDKIDNMFEPALSLRVLEIYDTVALDGLVNHNRFGGGLSVRLPSRYTTNTYIGGGLCVDYDSSEKSAIAYLKINF